MVSAIKFESTGDNLFEFLGDGRPFSKGINDVTENFEPFLLMLGSDLLGVVPSGEADETVLINFEEGVESYVEFHSYNYKYELTAVGKQRKSTFSTFFPLNQYIRHEWLTLQRKSLLERSDGKLVIAIYNYLNLFEMSR